MRERPQGLLEEPRGLWQRLWAPSGLRLGLWDKPQTPLAKAPQHFAGASELLGDTAGPMGIASGLFDRTPEFLEQAQSFWKRPRKFREKPQGFQDERQAPGGAPGLVRERESCLGRPQSP